MKHLLVATLAAACFGTIGCDTTGQTTMLGAGIGAATAAATGHDALRGAAIGAASGAVLGKIVKHERQRAYEEGYYEGRYDRGERGYPVGQRTENRGFVVSPFPPHHVIDVRGIPRGAKVQDPSNGRIFINP